MYYTEELYSKNANGKIILWQGKIEDDNIIIRTGQLGGTIRNISTPYPKDYNNAIKKLTAKFKLKLKQGYKTLAMLGDDIATLELEGNRLIEVLDTRLSINKTDVNNVLKPMKAQTFVKGKCKYPMIAQPKINGFRCTSMLVKDIPVAGNMFADGSSNAKLLTKEGHEYVVPHISKEVINILNMYPEVVLDGEIYVHNEILSNINRRLPMRKIGSNTISKNSLPIEPLTFCVFDLSIPDMSQVDRFVLKNELLLQCNDIYYSETSNKYIVNDKYIYNKYTNIINIRARLVNSDEEALKLRNAAIDSGFEGIILRDLDAEYQFGGRRNNMVKYKALKHSEFEVLDVILKKEDSVRTYVDFKLKNDINDLTFEVSVQGDEEQRQEYINNPEKYIGRRITLGFGERTVQMKPFHVKTMAFRESYDLDINDLNIEE